MNTLARAYDVLSLLSEIGEDDLTKMKTLNNQSRLKHYGFDICDRPAIDLALRILKQRYPQIRS